MRFDTDKNIYYLFYQIAVTGTPVWIALTENDLTIFRNNMKKFIEWEAIARKGKRKHFPGIAGVGHKQGKCYTRLRPPKG